MNESFRVSASDFGAKGDANTDDTSALQDCISTVADNGGGIVYLGRHVISRALKLPSGVVLAGAGRSDNVHLYASLRGRNCEGAMVEHHGASNSERVNHSGLYNVFLDLQGEASGETRTHGAHRGVSLKNCGVFTMHNVTLRGGQGAHIWGEEQVQDSHFWNVRCLSPQVFQDSNEAVINITAPEETVAQNALTFRDITIENALGPAFKIAGSQSRRAFHITMDGIKVELPNPSVDAQWDYFDFNGVSYANLRNVHTAIPNHAGENFYDHSFIKATACDRIIIDGVNINHRGTLAHKHQAITLDNCQAIQIDNIFENGFTAPESYREIVRVLNGSTHNLHMGVGNSGIGNGNLWQHVTGGGGWTNDPVGTASGNWYVEA